MQIFTTLTPEEMSEKAKALYNEERTEKKILNGWFISREIASDASEGKKLTDEERALCELEAVIDKIPLEISENAIFAGTQRDAFAASYALINPTFTVENFKGYCDPLEVYNFAFETESMPAERILAQKNRSKESNYVKALTEVYAACSEYTGEVAFFVEQVTGHLVPDFRPVLEHGLLPLISDMEEKSRDEKYSAKQRENFSLFSRAMKCAITLARRYREIILHELYNTSNEKRKAELSLMAETLDKVPAQGADNLYEAIQSYMLLWQVMCLEQAPNPFAFSVGGADRIFWPYMEKSGASRKEAAALFRHFLVFFNVGERSWAISQNIILSGRDTEGNDLTNPMTYAILDAYYSMNLPQPILSVKLHKRTPKELWESLGRFLFSPGVLTPSLFNDDSLFEVLSAHGIQRSDLPDYSIAGCQEPLIMGKDSPNTTNSWLNLAKILELTLNGGRSQLTGEKIGRISDEPFESILKNLRERFYDNLDFYCEEMQKSANGATKALSFLRIPFLSSFMGGRDTGIDTRDPNEQGTVYNGSGCLIHGLSVVADSFVAVDRLLKEKPEWIPVLKEALKNNFDGYEELHTFLKEAPKYGNNYTVPDQEAVEIATKVSQKVRSLKNNLGNPFRPDWSSPSTHLLYGYWVGATPDGRLARDMLGYGVDPLYGDATGGLGFRTLSALKLPYQEFNGGVASHFGIDPKYFTAETMEEKGVQFRDRVINPLFFNENINGAAPFYLYVNVTTAETLRAVLKDPKKYAPSGVYIMRIHGTFVNFLDLSPAIQEDIIRRLDPGSTVLC